MLRPSCRTLEGSRLPEVGPTSPGDDRRFAGQRHTGRPRTRPLDGLGLAGPAALLLLILFFLPVAAVLAIASTDWQLGAPEIRFVGLSNFVDLAADPVFRRSLGNTALFVAVAVPVTTGLALAIALLIESGQTLRGLYRTLAFLPFMATMAAMALSWEALLHPTIGLVNEVLRGAGLPTTNWLRDEATVLGALGAIFVWQNLGYALVLFLAGLKSIPPELYEAAEVDGADRGLARLTTVTLPLLSPVAMFVIIVVGVRAFEVFDIVKVLTRGGPAHASEMLLHTLYGESFDFLRTGYGAAISVVFLVLVVALTLIQARVMDRRVHYQ